MKRIDEVLESLADQLDNVMMKKYNAGTINDDVITECAKLYREICETAARLPMERPRSKPVTHVRILHKK